MKPNRKKRSVILVVEDDDFAMDEICPKLRDRNLDFLIARSLKEAYGVLKTHASQISVALLDIRIPRNASVSKRHYIEKELGLELARFIRENYRHIRLIGMSFYSGEEVRDWFQEYGFAYLRKTWLMHGASKDFIDVVEQAVRKPYRKKKPVCFIVHGHDNDSLHELTNFLKSNLTWPQPVILRELPSLGRTIIEKFEDAAQTVDLVFVLLTPDDFAASTKEPNAVKRRARQNVIFELGYFFAKLQRIGGRVILLYKGGVDLPTDISGIVYVDISNGIQQSGEILRKELSPWL